MQIDRLKLLDEIKNSCDFYYSGLFDKKKEQTSKKVEFIKLYIYIITTQSSYFIEKPFRT